MSDGDASLSQALSQLSEAADIVASDEVEEVARVRKARAGVTEHARQNGDCAGSLLASLLGESNAELEEARNQKERAAREAEERKKAEKEAEEEKKRAEAQARLDKEKKRLEEKEQRRLKMLADLEQKRKMESGELKEEEEKKRAEEEAKAAELAAQLKAAEEAKAAALAASNEELAEQIRIKNEEKKALEAARAAKIKQRRTIIAVAGVIALTVVVLVFVNNLLGKKAPDFYDPAYKTADLHNYITINLTTAEGAQFAQNDVATKLVVQDAPKSAVKSRGPKKNNDRYGLGEAKDVLSGSGKIVK